VYNPSCKVSAWPTRNNASSEFDGSTANWVNWPGRYGSSKQCRSDLALKLWLSDRCRSAPKPKIAAVCAHISPLASFVYARWALGDGGEKRMVFPLFVAARERRMQMDKVCAWPADWFIHSFLAFESFATTRFWTTRCLRATRATLYLYLSLSIQTACSVLANSLGSQL
jgi:hypothetical protein